LICIHAAFVEYSKLKNYHAISLASIRYAWGEPLCTSETQVGCYIYPVYHKGELTSLITRQIEPEGYGGRRCKRVHTLMHPKTPRLVQRWTRLGCNIEACHRVMYRDVIHALRHSETDDRFPLSQQPPIKEPYNLFEAGLQT
jgi:hypothetical protein